ILHFVLTLIQMRQPETVLEVGTAIEYSSMRIASELPHAVIDTVEKDESMVAIANDNIKSYDYNQQITVLHGDGLEVMNDLVAKDSSYDCIFIEDRKSVV